MAKPDVIIYQKGNVKGFTASWGETVHMCICAWNCVDAYISAHVTASLKKEGKDSSVG